MIFWGGEDLFKLFTAKLMPTTFLNLNISAIVLANLLQASVNSSSNLKIVSLDNGLEQGFPTHGHDPIKNH